MRLLFAPKMEQDIKGHSFDNVEDSKKKLGCSLQTFRRVEQCIKAYVIKYKNKIIREGGCWNILNKLHILGYHTLQSHRKYVLRTSLVFVLTTFKMRINTMGVPFKFTGYRFQPLLSDGLSNSKICLELL